MLITIPASEPLQSIPLIPFLFCLLSMPITLIYAPMQATIIIVETNMIVIRWDYLCKLLIFRRLSFSCRPWNIKLDSEPQSKALAAAGFPIAEFDGAAEILGRYTPGLICSLRRWGIHEGLSYFPPLNWEIKWWQLATERDFNNDERQLPWTYDYYLPLGE